jgi:hypothetical protein
MLKKFNLQLAGAAIGAGMVLAASAMQAEAQPRRHYDRGSNVGAALAVSALALGVGAAVAASRRDYYQGPGYGYESAYLGYSGYGYAPGYPYGSGYAEPAYPDAGYASRRYYGPTGYGSGNYWQRRERNRQQYLQN